VSPRPKEGSLPPGGTPRSGEGTPVRIRLVVIGGSAGGVAALGRILPALPADFGLPVVVILHQPPSRPSLLADLFGRKCRLPVVEAYDKAQVEPGHIYFSPPDYHLMMESDFTFGLSVDGPVNFSRPSIDVLLESAAASIGEGVLAIILTGTNADGARGMKAVRAAGGTGWVQAPQGAHSPTMPRAALEIGGADAVLDLDEIAQALCRLPAAGSAPAGNGLTDQGR
jgi:two-component system, chemotaxis family, protein-glutamate methylesterase/glutaminase